MSHLKVKTTYNTLGTYGSTETNTLYCHHNQSCDMVLFYDDPKGEQLTKMVFASEFTGNDLWDAMNRLWFPYEDVWGGQLKEGVELWRDE